MKFIIIDLSYTIKARMFCSISKETMNINGIHERFYEEEPWYHDYNIIFVLIKKPSIAFALNYVTI